MALAMMATWSIYGNGRMKVFGSINAKVSLFFQRLTSSTSKFSFNSPTFRIVARVSQMSWCPPRMFVEGRCLVSSTVPWVSLHFRSEIRSETVISFAWKFRMRHKFDMAKAWSLLAIADLSGLIRLALSICWFRSFAKWAENDPYWVSIFASQSFAV